MGLTPSGSPMVKRLTDLFQGAYQIMKTKSFLIFILLIGLLFLIPKQNIAKADVTIDEFLLPSGGGPAGITSGPDGNLWFGEWCGFVIGRITTNGAITTFPTSGGCTLNGTSGTDGNLWFTGPLYGEPPGGNIIRVTPTGQLTEIPIPTQNQFDPDAIISGPDGNIWFTEYSGGKIVKYTLATGSFTEYPVGGSPGGLTFGPDGNIWFTDRAGLIGKMTPDGVVTKFPIPDGFSKGPCAIIAGPDGNLWFSEYWGNVGRITPSGDITEFPIPSGNGTSAITKGPDGNLWFTEIWNSKIGKITPTGEISEYPIPTSNSTPRGISSGPDGNIWFTEMSSGKIGRITLTIPDTTPPALNLPDTKIVNATGSNGAYVSYDVTATDPDNQPSDLIISCSPASRSVFPIGTTTVSCSANDPAGNTTIGSFQVEVIVNAPTSKDQCKKGGWKNYIFPSFKNQGDCVSYVTTHGENPPDGSD
jgi:streptogramin lyase